MTPRWTRRAFGWTCMGAAAAAALRPAFARAAEDELAAVRAEMDRALEALRLPNAPAPWHIEVRLVRADTLSLDGSYGGVLVDLASTSARGSVSVRVGTPDRDNSGFLSGPTGVEFSLPLEPDAKVTRKAAWLAIDRAYRGAVAAYDAKQKALSTYPTNPPPDGLAPGAGARIHVPWASEGQAANVPRPGIELDREGLRALVRDLSGRFKAKREVDNGDVVVQALRSFEILVDTEGLVLGRRLDRSLLAVVADTRASDGMPVDHGDVIHLHGLPTNLNELRTQGQAMVDRVLDEIVELAHAPMLEEDYDGPVLLSSRAACELVASTVANHALGLPAPLSDYGRAVELEPFWLEKLGQIVMPNHFDLIDDPAAAGFGHYDIDDEGVTPQAVRLVKAGVLEDVLRGRTRTTPPATSNGHARVALSLGKGPTISNLRLVANKPGLSQAKLEALVLERAAEDGWRYAYVLDSFRDGTLLGPVAREGASTYASGRKIGIPIPGRLFKLAAGGKRTLVRGAVIEPTSMRLLRRIRAHGVDTDARALRIAPGMSGGFGADIGVGGLLFATVDAEVRAPALLVDGLELAIERGEFEREPYLIHPLRDPARGKPA